MNNSRVIRFVTRGVMVAAAVAAISSAMSAPAYANPEGPPCNGIAGLLCKVIPMAPALEGDIDLTTNQPVDPSVPPPEDRRPADICANGCM